MTFDEVIKEYILPLFPGSSLEETKVKRNKTSYDLVTQLNAQKLGVMQSANSEERTIIVRSQPFTNQEINIIKIFIEKIAKILTLQIEEELKKTLFPAVFKGTIAETTFPEAAKTISLIIDLLENLSGRTYEGNNLSIAIGIEKKDNQGSIDISSFLANDFGLVLSNGIHSIIVASYDGKVCSHECLEDNAPNKHSPIAYLSIANWSKGNRVAIVLNRNGEILIFFDGILLFTKRRQKWQFYSHETIIKAIAAGSNTSWKPALRAAVYESSLDVSFSRSGGLIGLVSRTSKEKALSLLLTEDIPGTGNSIKSSFITSMNYPKFQDLHRRIRQELLAIDGCVLLDYQGNIMNIGGLITKINPSTEGGARTAAAIATSTTGVSIKISMDGMIKGFKNQNEILRFG